MKIIHPDDVNLLIALVFVFFVLMMFVSRSEGTELTINVDDINTTKEYKFNKLEKDMMFWSEGFRDE